MAALIIILAWLAALVLAAVKFINALDGGFLAWCGWLALLIVCVLALVDRVGAYRTHP